jgi:tetratricopeptide (TPR) repeat protein
MRFIFVLWLTGTLTVWAQTPQNPQNPQSQSPANQQSDPSQPQSSSQSNQPASPAPNHPSDNHASDKNASDNNAPDTHAPGPAPSAGAQNPKLSPPRSDSIDASALDDEPGTSSSNDTRIDLSPPENDVKAHPLSGETLEDEGSGNTGQVHAWDPHKAAKDVEVGDFYFRRKNYKAAEDRYREALLYKDNDALATYRLAVCLEKMGRPSDALEEFETYLKILPYGPQAKDSQKAIARLRESSETANPGK